VLTATWQNGANLLTVGRVACIPILLLLLSRADYTTAFYVFLAAAVSDALDGFLAKHVTGVTKIGAILDPIADKLLLSVMLGGLAYLAVLPAWLFFVILLRDIGIIIGVILLRRRRPDFTAAPHLLGKLTTFAQLLLVGAALAGLAFGPPPAGLVPALVLATAFLTVASATAYAVLAARLARPAAGGAL
jgi:cardiolipin synthase